MVDFDYTEAHKLAVREYRRATSRGESPYPVCLDERLPSQTLAEGKRLGREQIPLALVIGTKHEGRNHAFARNFMPLLGSGSEFAAKWKSLCRAHLEEGIREPVKLYEYRNRFYVEEGNKRVSILKYFDADSIEAEVIRIPSQRLDGPKGEEDAEEARMYDAFLQFYRSSRLRTVEFSRPESFRRLQELMGKMPEHAGAGDEAQEHAGAGDEAQDGGAWPVWTVDEQREFKSMYYYFHREYTKAGGNGHLPWVCDALLQFIEKYGYEAVCQMYSGEIRDAIEASASELGIRRSRADRTVLKVKRLPAATVTEGRRIAAQGGKQAVKGGKQVIRGGKQVVKSGTKAVKSGRKVVRAGRQLASRMGLGPQNGSTGLPGIGLRNGSTDAFGIGPRNGSTGVSVLGTRNGSTDALGIEPRRRFRILTVADDECRQFYEDYRPGNLDGFDLILACGDLHRTYLEFLTTMAACPVLYVRGNHDDLLLEEPPGGCVCVEDQVYVHEGLRIVGLGGSFRYREGKNMYTEEQMRKRVRRLNRQIRRHGGFDILMTHAPAKGINDFDSLSHRGFETFRQLLELYRPQYFVHGHIHKNYGVRIPQRTRWNGTTVINAYEHCVFEVEI